MVRTRMVNNGAGNGARANERWSPPAAGDKARALERLAEARAHLGDLERQAAPAVEPSIRAAVEKRQQEINQLRNEIRSGKRGRAAKQARQQIEALEGTQRLVVECLGYRSFEEFQAMTARADATRVDNHLLQAARQEVDRAERHFFDTAEMAIPVPSGPRGAVPAGPRPAPVTSAMPVVDHRFRVAEQRWAG